MFVIFMKIVYNNYGKEVGGDHMQESRQFNRTVLTLWVVFLIIVVVVVNGIYAFILPMSTLELYLGPLNFFNIAAATLFVGVLEDSMVNDLKKNTALACLVRIPYVILIVVAVFFSCLLLF